MADVNFGDFDRLGQALSELKQKKDELSEQLKLVNKEMEIKSLEVLELFDRIGNPEYKTHTTPYCKLQRRTSYMYKFPQDLDRKLELIEHMGQDRFIAQASIHYRTFNTYCNEVVERARETGDIDALNIPGVDPPTADVSVAILKV